SPKAIKNAVYQAHLFVDKRINEHICEDIENNLDGRGSLWQHIKEIVAGPEDYPKDPETSEETSDPSKN
ncbi:MAG: phosphate acyltransferase, partial [Nitrospinaceae bacterium]